ncbi:hypothetical protein ACFLV7_13155 [Chloroflexota bacterium]
MRTKELLRGIKDIPSCNSQLQPASEPFPGRNTYHISIPLIDAFSMEHVREQEQATVVSVKELAWQADRTVDPFYFRCCSGITWLHAPVYHYCGFICDFNNNDLGFFHKSERIVF